jgi:hypothetical protein
MHRVIARIDPRHRRDRAELSDRGVGDLGVVHDIGIVAHRYFEQDGAGADFAIGAKRALANGRAGVDGRFDRKHFAGHASFHRRGSVMPMRTSSVRLMTAS